MSYEPHILINYAQLIRCKQELERLESRELVGSPAQRAYKALLNAIAEPAIIIGRFKLSLIRPDLTQHNRRVREALADLNITFGVAD